MQVEGDVLESEMLLVSTDGAVRDRESKVLRMDGATWTKKIRRGRRETASMQVEGDVVESEMLLV